jgi:primosomal protein N' (replication factor Y) (superfamily II helicase)
LPPSSADHSPDLGIPSPAAAPRYAEVAVAAPLGSTLTYEIPSEMAASLLPGMRLLVPLGRQLLTGYLLGFPAEPPAGFKIKAIAEPLDNFPLFPENMIPFYRWIATYYRYPIGEVIKTGLPGGMSPSSGRRITLTAEGETELAAEEAAHPWLSKLRQRGELGPAAVRRLWQQAGTRRLLLKWQEKGLITIASELGKDGVGPKKELCVQPVAGKTEAQLLKPSERKTLDLLSRLTTEEGRDWISRRDLVRDYSGARKTLPALLAMGLVTYEERPVYRDPFGEPPAFFPKPQRLSAEQTAALLEIDPAVRDKKFTTFLLHGVTDSGKTEVYLRATATALAIGRGVLVLVPEIALATQVEAHFLSRFGDRVAILHSGLSAGEKFDQWQRLADGRAMIAIGARSAVFAPLRDPGLIIVDEEHDSAYKQEDGLRYQARDLAVLRGSLQQATVLLGSATPAVNSFRHGANGKYRLISLKSRVENRPLPQVEVIDLRTIKTKSGHPPLFAESLIEALRATLAAGDQSLLFLNRRGFANLLLCRQCSQTLSCRHCNVTLTFHKGRGELLCHYCGYTVKSTTSCPNCQASDFFEIGFGTERVEAEIQQLFPQARIARLDRDTSVDRKKYLTLLRSIRERRIDIMVGTQMLAKGLHFPHVTLVGVVWADAGMGLPDYKAGERTFQLLAQVTGRTGRGDKPGRVLIQTCQPDHYAVVTARLHDYYSFFSQEISLRQSLGYPPFSRLINLRLEGEKESEVQTAALELARIARQAGGRGVDVLGPAPAPISKLRGRFRWQLLLKGSELEPLHQLCSRIMEQPPAAVRGKTVKLTVDVDPDNML